MPQGINRQSLRATACKWYLYALGFVLLLIPCQGSSWDEPSEMNSYASMDVDLLLLLSDDSGTSMVGPESTIYGEAVPDGFVAAAASRDCIDLWRAYVHAIVQVELAQANAAKIQAAIEKCLEKRDVSAALIEPLPASAFLGSDTVLHGDVDVELGADGEVSILD